MTRHPLMPSILSADASPVSRRTPLTNTHARSIRDRNRGLVLRTLMQRSGISRADLARITGLARPTISEVVKSLIDEGVIRESGQSQDARPGKPAVMLEFDQRAVQVIALDLSAPDRVVGALATPDGGLAHRRVRPSDADAVQAAGAIVAELAMLASSPPLGVGVGVPSGAPALLGLHALLAQTVDAPVHLFDDADLAADAELQFGGLDSDFLLVRLGTRIGTAIRAFDDDGAPVERSTGARELAHVIAGGDPGDACPCGRIGCVHAWASVPALARRLDEATAADRGEVLAAAGTRLGTSLSVIAAAVDLPTIVLSGPPTAVGDELIAAAAAAVQAASHPSRGPEVRGSTLDDAVLRGAAARVVSHAFSAR